MRREAESTALERATMHRAAGGTPLGGQKGICQKGCRSFQMGLCTARAHLLGRASMMWLRSQRWSYRLRHMPVQRHMTVRHQTAAGSQTGGGVSCHPKAGVSVKVPAQHALTSWAGQAGVGGAILSKCARWAC